MANFQPNQQTDSFDCDGYSSFLTSGLYELYKQKTFCDITVSVGHRSFLAHKAVLGVVSPYFKTMFTSGFQEADSSAITIEGDGETFAALLRFAYTGNLQLSEATVRDVLSMACYMQIDKVIQLCEQFVSKTTSDESMSFETACMLLPLAVNLCLRAIAATLRKFLITNILEFIQTDLFLDPQTVDVILDCFQNSDAMAHLECSEEKILNIMLSWMRHDWHQRKEYAESLLKHVRLCLVPVECLKELIDDELPGCKTLLAEASQIIETSKAVNPLTLARKYPSLCAPRGLTTALMVTSAYYACYYDTTRQSWAQFSMTPPGFISDLDNITNHTMIVVGDELYAAGGQIYVEGTSSATNNFFRYNPATNDWDALEKMNKARQKCALVELAGYIYVVSDNERSVERYSIAEGKWSNPDEVSPMLMAVHNVSAIRCNGNFCVYGGDMPGVIQIYIPSTNTWYNSNEIYLTDPHDDTEEVAKDYPPVLTVHNGKYYLVSTLYIIPDLKHKVNVLQWDVSFEADVPSLSFRGQHSQDQIPKNDCDAFVIEGDVFVAVGGCVHNTGIKIVDGKSNTDLTTWKSLFDGGIQYLKESVVCYTFDRLALLP